MDATPASPLQALILRRLAELGDVTGPMSIREAVRRSGGVLGWEQVRQMARGERGDILTTGEAQALAQALDVPVGEVESTVTVLPDV